MTEGPSLAAAKSLLKRLALESRSQIPSREMDAFDESPAFEGDGGMGNFDLPVETAPSSFGMDAVGPNRTESCHMAVPAVGPRQHSP